MPEIVPEALASRFDVLHCSEMLEEQSLQQYKFTSQALSDVVLAGMHDNIHHGNRRLLSFYHTFPALRTPRKSGTLSPRALNTFLL